MTRHVYINNEASIRPVSNWLFIRLGFINIPVGFL